MWNQHDYSVAHLEFARWIIEKLGHKAPDVQTIINLEVEIDHAAVKELGFTKERFPSSLQKTYKSICKSSGIVPNENDLENAYKIGLMAFSPNQWKSNVVEGSRAVLNYLKYNKKDKLVLLTKGDEEIQRSKIMTLELDRLFDKKNIMIVPQKDEFIFDKFISKEYGRKQTYHVGNSIKSDVIPAINAEINIIYIPCETWSYERDHQGIPQSSFLKQIENISQIKDVYDFL